mgnify:CR=1 FL=1
MAEDSDLEKSESASPRRLEQAREEGQVPHSRELATFISLMVGVVAPYVLGRWGGHRLMDIMKTGLSLPRSLAFEPGHIELRINDNGRGFNVAAVSAHPTAGIGLRNMRERLAAIGGHLEVHADRLVGPMQPGIEGSVHGTLVMATVPRQVLQHWAFPPTPSPAASLETLT